jgi:hypothetical protein
MNERGAHLGTKPFHSPAESLYPKFMTLALPIDETPWATLIAAIRALYGPGPIPLHRPVFVDVDRETLGLSPVALAAFLDQFGERWADGVYTG